MRCAALLKLDGQLGLHGWQWLFLVEAAVTVLYGVYCLATLTDGPASVRLLGNVLALSSCIYSIVLGLTYASIIVWTCLVPDFVSL